MIKGLGGKGTISYYPDYVLTDIILIKQLKKKGKTLDEIKKFLHESEYKRKRKFQKVVSSNRYETWKGIYEEVKKTFPDRMIMGLDTELHKQGNNAVRVTSRIQFCPPIKLKN